MYDKTTQERIIALKTKGVSSRSIANELNISKSGVNDYFNARILKNTKEKLKGKPKVLVFDLETSAATALTFGRFKVNLSQDNIIQEGGWMLCASWRWMHEDVTRSIHLTPTQIKNQDDLVIACTLHALYEEADVVIAHNSHGFDHKVLQTRCLANNLPPLPSVKVLDTLQMAKKHLRLPSNKLDSIADYFNLGRKFSTGGISLWKKVQSGDVQAMQDMVLYCKQDVDLLLSIYLKIRAVSNAGTGFNAGMYGELKEEVCGTCGSSDVEPTGRTVKSTLSSFLEYRCNDCGSLHRTRDTNVSTKQRKNLLMNV